MPQEALEANRTLLEDSMELAHMADWEYDVVSGMFVFNDPFYALDVPPRNAKGSTGCREKRM